MSIEAHLKHTVGAFELDVSFSVCRPGITALFGPSGAGKTTIVNALAGLIRPQRGKIVRDGQVLLDTDRGQFVSPRHRRIGYVFQDSRLFPHLSVLGNLRFGWLRTGRKDEIQFNEVVDLLGLDSLLKRKPAGLSGGERGRVAIGRALLSNPSLLLLDEPLAALDAARREEILPYFDRLRSEYRLPMIYVTHSIEELSRLADDVIVLRHGKVTKQGNVFDLFSDLDFTALTGVATFGTVLPVRVREHCQQESLSILEFDGGQLVSPRIDRQVGTRLRVRIRAEDVLLALEVPAAISANNVLPVKAAALHDGGDSYVDVQLECGNTRFVARITKASLVRLGIVPGSILQAIIKSVTIDPRLDLPGD